MLDRTPPALLSSALGVTAPHAVVIGSGFGGLAAAVRLGARGYRVTVLEQLDAPGGRAYVYQQDGFTFDAGPTIVTAPNLFEELWTLCGRRMSDDVKLVEMGPYYRIRFDDGSVFDYSGDAEEMKAEVAKFAPSDLAGYGRFIRRAKRQYEYGFERLGNIPFHNYAEMIKAVPRIIALGGHRSVHHMVAKEIKDERLRIAFSFHSLLIGGNPFAVSGMYSLINWMEQSGGVHFAMGGTGSLVKGLVGLIEGQGNSLRCDARVERITSTDTPTGRRVSGVRLASGEEIAADIVVSNAETAHTYKHLLPGTRRKRWTNSRLARSKYSMGVFLWYFGTDRRYEDVAHHTIVLGPRYRGLLDDIFHRKVLAKDFSLYLHRPTATDPSMAPAGCDTFYALSPVPHLQSGTDWQATAEPYRRAVMARLQETLLPGLEDALVTSRVLTPLDFKTRLLSENGAAFGLEPLLLQSAFYRPHNRSEELQGLYIVGAGTHPGAGLPGVLSTARILDSVVPDVHAFA